MHAFVWVRLSSMSLFVWCMRLSSCSSSAHSATCPKSHVSAAHASGGSHIHSSSSLGHCDSCSCIGNSCISFSRVPRSRFTCSRVSISCISRSCGGQFMHQLPTVPSSSGRPSVSPAKRTPTSSSPCSAHQHAHQHAHQYAHQHVCQHAHQHGHNHAHHHVDQFKRHQHPNQRTALISPA